MVPLATCHLLWLMALLLICRLFGLACGMLPLRFLLPTRRLVR